MERIMLNGFLKLNRELCRILDRVWPYPLAATFWESYATQAGAIANSAEPAKVVDVGAGRTTPYAPAIADATTELIGIDVLGDDLAANQLLTRYIVCDFVKHGIPKEAEGAGLVTSRMVIEHVPDLENFAQSVYRTLAPAGRTVHLFAARYSIFAILNRLLPDSLSRRVLFALRPESVEVGGFPTFYDHTHAKAAKSVFERAGMINVEIEVSYQTSQYFHFFFPLFVVARIWETVLHRLALENLGSYVLLTARRA